MVETAISARYPVTAKVAKFVLPRIGRLLAGRRRQEALAIAETGLAMLQGRGSGCGWDIDAEVAVALRFIAHDGVVFDVGANCGSWAERVLAARGDAKLYLFEPQQACHAAMSEAVCEKAILVQAAVGETETQMPLYSPGEASGLASLHARKDFADLDFHPMNVQVITLDEFIAQHEIKSVDFMKMDIEGHELFARAGPPLRFVRA